MTSTLTDDQVAAMRSSVMHTVDQDVRRRGRRARRAGGLVAASVLLVGIGTAGVHVLDLGTSTSADSAGGGSVSEIQSSAPDAARDDSGKVVAQDRQVVTTGQVNMTVKDPRAVLERISTYVESLGGRVDKRTATGEGDRASAFVEVRVPSSRVTATLERLATYGSVDDVTTQNDDVTSQATDLDARIRALRVSIDRLEQIMASSRTSGELIKAETVLTKRQEQLEQLVAQRKDIADRVSLSTLSIDLSPPARPDSVDPDGFTGGLRDGWDALVSTVNRTVEVVGALLPWTAVLLALYGAYRLVVRRRRR
jgi:hypothetical protein